MTSTQFKDLVHIAGPTRERDPFSFAAAARVAFSDTDAQGIVYYGRYSAYFDVARVEYFRHLDLRGGYHTGDRGGDFVMRHFNIDYHAPAQFDDPLAVFCRVAKIGNSSMNFEFAVVHNETDTLLATATQVLVFVDLDKRKPLRVPDAVRTNVETFEAAR